MELILNRVYHLSGEGFGKSALAENRNLFALVGISSNGKWRFEGVVDGATQWSSQYMIDEGDAQITLVPKKYKRKKGERNKAPTVNKATILFMSGVSYTIKNLEAIHATASETVFVLKYIPKGTVSYSETITVPNMDVNNIYIRGVEEKFYLNMSESANGIIIVDTNNLEIIASEFKIAL